MFLLQCQLWKWIYYISIKRDSDILINPENWKYFIIFVLVKYHVNQVFLFSTMQYHNLFPFFCVTLLSTKNLELKGAKYDFKYRESHIHLCKILLADSDFLFSQDMVCRGTKLKCDKPCLLALNWSVTNIVSLIFLQCNMKSTSGNNPTKM